MYTFSGLDSSGKTTQIELIREYCKNNNIDYSYKWGKGRATPVVMFLKRIFRRDKKMNDQERKEYREEIYQNRLYKFALLTISIFDLWWFWGILYRFLRNKHEVLICDRYVWDTYVDIRTEFKEFNIDRWLIWKIAVILAPVPHHSFLLFIPAQESFDRDKAKGDNTADSIEKKVEKAKEYERLIAEKKWDTVIDGMLTRQEIFSIVKRNLFK